MSKFIGEMTFDEFIDALKIILFSQTEDKEKDNRSFKEKVKDFFVETYNDFKYLFSKQLFLDIKKDFIEFCRCIKNFSLTALFKDICNYFVSLYRGLRDIFVKPLTKERFIYLGKKFKVTVVEIFSTVIFVVVMVILIRFFVGEIRWIPSGSMRPTLIEGDRIFVERFSRFYSTPKRGDIMVFYPPFEELKNSPGKVFARLTGFFCKDIAYIKRVVGMPGEKYEIKVDDDGKYTVYINDRPLTEPYIRSPYDYTPCTEAMNCGPTIIPPKHYLMLGDNRGNSQDGRYWGLLPENRFIGKAVFLFWPFGRVKSLNF